MAQVLAAAESWLSFFQWAPSLGATSYQQAVALYGANLPGISPECQDVAVNHGHFFCLPWGSVSSNPWGFALCTLFLISGFAFVAYSQRRGKGFFCAQFTELVRTRIDVLRQRFGFDGIDSKRVSLFIGGALLVATMLTMFFVSMLVSHVNP